MITKATAKLIRELHEKKHRTEHKMFLVEGEKSVLELLASDFIVTLVLVTPEFQMKYKDILSEKTQGMTDDGTEKKAMMEMVSAEELEKLGTLESNNAALAVVVQKEQKSFSPEDIQGSSEIVLALDDIRDPGNLGTIIRIADWYGISHIICSENTTDFYNSKTISATKGSFTRVSVSYTDLTSFLNDAQTKQIPILGAFLDGEDVHSFNFPKTGILVMGSESHGIGDMISALVTQKITIPRFGKAESLNASIATAIIIDNWKRTI